MDIESLKKLIQEYVNEHPEQFEKAALDIDAIVDEVIHEYDSSVETIKQSVIDDPNPDIDPETEMLKQVKELQAKLSREVQRRLDVYVEGVEQDIK